jgi:hypothetical protein
MGYKVLVTLDLPGATEEQRSSFYDVLTTEKWAKMSNMTTAWRASFADTFNRNTAISTLQSHLKKAKNESKVKMVDYAMQLDESDVVINHI